VFSVGQRAAVGAAFRLAGYDGPLRTAPVTSGDERVFVLPDVTLARIDTTDLGQVLQGLLGIKVWVVGDGQFQGTVRFE
jgi:hypothetical protein